MVLAAYREHGNACVEHLRGMFAFLIYDTETGAYELIRVAYDIQRTARAIREVGLPEFLAQRLFQGS